MPDERLLRDIDDAAADRRLVRVTRRRGWDRLDGSIVARSTKWLLLATAIDAGFHGHSLVRVSDVRRVETRGFAEFAERALAAEGHWPLPELERVDVSSTRAALRSLAQADLMVSLYYEQDHSDECQIGFLRDLDRKTFRLQTIDPGAVWDGDDQTFRYRSISRVDVGGAYERRLLAVGGPPPPWSKP